ncbi:MAG: cation diffusion facilitator family transporter [Verrucomicrobiota bacterium]|jgi:cation diffusion facilitator family transporter
MERLDRGLRTTFVGMLVNGVLASGKFVAGWVGHSHALVADAVESFADLFSSVIVWRGLVVAAQPADKEHPYGHGKAEPIAAAFVAALLLLASVWIAIHAVREIITPHLPPAPFTLVVLILVVIIKEILFRFVRQEAVLLESTAMHSDAWHHRSDAITSLAAGLGISVALIGGPEYAYADDVAAVFAAGIIAFNGWRLLRPALDELMDTAPSPETLEEVRRIAGTISGVEAVEKCMIRKMGYYYFVDMHLEVDPKMSVQRAHDIAHEVKDKIRQEISRVRDVLVHIEPAPDRRQKPGASF